VEKDPESGGFGRYCTGIRKVLKAFELSSGGLYDGLRALTFQIVGRLVKEAQDDEFVAAYVEKTVSVTPVPCVIPVNQFMSGPQGGLVAEISVGGSCWSVDCSPCGRFIAAGAGEDVVVLDVASRRTVGRLRGHSDLVTGVKFVMSSKLVSCSSDESVMVWDWKCSSAPVMTLTGHTDRINDVCVSRDGKHVFSVSDDKTLKVWDMGTGLQSKEVVQRCGVDSVCVCPAGRNVALGLDDGTVKVVDVDSAATIFESESAHTDTVRSVAFSPDGKVLATGSDDGTVRLWDATSWAPVGGRLQGHSDWVRCVSFSACGERVVSASDDGTVRLWSVEDAQCVGMSPKLNDLITSACFSADGTQVICGSWNGLVRMWDAELDVAQEEQVSRHGGDALCVAMSGDGSRVASGWDDGTVRLLDAESGNETGAPLQGHTDWVRCVAFSANGKQLVSGSDDRTLRVWDTATGALTGRPLEGHTDWVTCVAFSSDGLRIISGGSDGTIRIWDRETQAQIGDVMEGHSDWVTAVAESSDAVHIVSRDRTGETIIWDRQWRKIVWRSSDEACGASDGLSAAEAERVIRRCGEDTVAHLWPDCFERFCAELYVEGSVLRSNLVGPDTALGVLPGEPRDWKYSTQHKVFVAALWAQGVALCSLRGRA
jgi:WD40 repeat protein